MKLDDWIKSPWADIPQGIADRLARAAANKFVSDFGYPPISDGEWDGDGDRPGCSELWIRRLRHEHARRRHVALQEGAA